MQKWMYRGMKLWRRVTGVGTWRYGDMEVWMPAIGAAIWRYGCLGPRCKCKDVEPCSSGDVEARCIPGTMEARRYGALEAR